MKVLCVLSLLFSLTQASVLNKRGKGTEISIASSKDFCLYLPPSPGQMISATGNDATAFCHTARSYAKAFPPGFIKSAHYLRTSTMVQVTGRMNHTKYNIQTEDGGGQYDYKKLPKGTCNGMKYWVSVIEPDDDIYCIRCCQLKEDCPTEISTSGCIRIIPGNYN